NLRSNERRLHVQREAEPSDAVEVGGVVKGRTGAVYVCLAGSAQRSGPTVIHRRELGVGARVGRRPQHSPAGCDQQGFAFHHTQARATRVRLAPYEIRTRCTQSSGNGFGGTARLSLASSRRRPPCPGFHPTNADSTESFAPRAQTVSRPCRRRPTPWR